MASRRCPLRSTKLQRRGGASALALSCTGAPCKGAVTLKAGTTVARKMTYSLAAGARKTVKLTLSASAARC